MRTVMLAAVLACLLLGDTVSVVAQDLARFDPSRGVGGFIGTVEPLQRPVTLSWGEKSGIVGAVETLSLLSNERRESITTTFTGSVRRTRGGFTRRFAVSELTINDQHVTADRPLIVVEAWSDPQGGNVSDLDVTFPGLIEKGIAAPPPNTPQHQLWVDLFAADLAYADRPIRINTSVFNVGSYHRLLERQVRGIMGDKDAVIVENDVATVAKGLTTVSGRKLLVAKLTGKIVGRSGANLLILEIGGFGLIDTETGLSSGTSRTDITAIQGGREVRRTVFVDVRLLN